MGLKELDRLKYAVQILDSIRDIMMLLESSTEKAIPVSVCAVFETSLEKAASLLDGVAETMEKEIAEADGQQEVRKSGEQMM